MSSLLPRCRFMRQAQGSASAVAINRAAASDLLSVAFSAFTRTRRSRRVKGAAPSSLPAPPAVPARATARKHGPPRRVTAAEMAAYQSRQSFFSRLSLLRLRLHLCFQLLQRQRALALTLTAAASPAASSLSPAARLALDATVGLFRSFAPFKSPFPAALLQHLAALYCLYSPSTALRLLAALPFDYDSHVRLLRALAERGEEAAVSELLRRLQAEHGAQQLNAQTAVLWLQSAAADVARLEAVWSELRRCTSLQLSSACYAHFIAPMAAAGRSVAVRQALVEMEADSIPLSPEVAAAVCRLTPAAAAACSSSSSSAFCPPLHYLPVLNSHGIAVSDGFLLCLLQHQLSQPSASSPEHAHLLLLWSSSLQLSSAAFSVVLRCYAHREHRGSGKIGLRDVLMIERLLTAMRAARLQEDDGVRQVRLMLAAQRGDGDEVLRLMRGCVEAAAGAACPPSSALFLPVLRSVAALSHSARLTVLQSLHAFLQSQRLSSLFSFSVLLQLQSELGDAAGMRRTLRDMKTAGVPLTMTHWQQLLACSSHSLSQVRLLRRMMTELHLLPGPLCDALVIARHAQAADVLGAELAFSAFVKSACPSPPLLLRIAMIDMYLQAGKVRHACRQAWKIVSGEGEKVRSSRDAAAAVDDGGQQQQQQQWKVWEELTEEEVLRLLRAMRQQTLGSRREIESLLAAVEEQSRQREAEATAELRRWRDELGLQLELSDDEQRLEDDRRRGERERRWRSSLLQLRSREEESGQRAARVSGPLAQRVGSLLRRLQQSVPFVHMDAVLNARKTAQEQQQPPAPAPQPSPGDDSAEEQQQQQAAAGSFFLSLNELDAPQDTLDAAISGSAGSAFTLHSGQQRGKSSPLPMTAEEAVSTALFKAANELVASRMPDSRSSRAEETRDSGQR